MVKKNFYEMVDGQAATGRVITGIVANVVTHPDKQFILTNVEGDAFVLKAEKDDEVIKITEKNALIAKYVMNPNPKPVPEVKYENGKFIFANGRTVLTGDLAITGIVATLPGIIIVGIDKGVEDVVELLAYDVQTDRFFDIDSDKKYVAKDSFSLTVGQNAFVVSNFTFNSDSDEETSGHAFITAIRMAYDELEVGVAHEFEQQIESIFAVKNGAMALRLKSADDELSQRLLVFEKPEFIYFCPIEIKIPQKSDENPFIAFGGKYNDIIVVLGKNYFIMKSNSSDFVIEDDNIVEIIKDGGYSTFANLATYQNDNGQKVVEVALANADNKVLIIRKTSTDRGDFYEVVD